MSGDTRCLKRDMCMVELVVELVVELDKWSTRQASVNDRPATGVEAAASATGAPGDSPKLGAVPEEDDVRQVPRARFSRSRRVLRWKA